jgi:hypothetical protein
MLMITAAGVLIETDKIAPYDQNLLDYPRGTPLDGSEGEE